MITRSSIAFEDLLASSIAPQAMQPWDRYTYLYICNIFIKWKIDVAIALGKTAMMTGAEAKNTGNKTNKKATKKEWKGVKNHPL